MKAEPLWKTAAHPKYPSVRRGAHYDLVVIGGGITGLTAAYLLKKAGKKVCVLERDHFGDGDTGYTTAHLTYVTDLRPAELLKTFGAQAGRSVWRAGATAIDTIEAIASDEQIDCNFQRVPGFLHACWASKQDEARALQNDAESAREMGFAAEYLAEVPLMRRPGVRFPDQAKFHPLKYLAGLARAVDGDGCAVFENAEVSEVNDDPLQVVVKKHKITADYVVVATHVPLMGKTGMLSAAMLQTKLYPYSSYAVGAKVPSGILPEACFWDTSEPYYYMRVEKGTTHDYVIYGGQDHKTGADVRHAEAIQKPRQVAPSTRSPSRTRSTMVRSSD